MTVVVVELGRVAIIVVVSVVVLSVAIKEQQWVGFILITILKIY